MGHTLNLTDRQAFAPARPAALPDLRDALLRPAMLGATLQYRYDADGSRDILTIAIDASGPRDVFDDDEAWLCCRLEELGLGQVSLDRLQLALANLPHTPDYDTHRQQRRRA